MPRAAVPPDLPLTPFRGSTAVAAGLITRRRLDGPAWRRLLPDVYIHRDTEMDHRSWCSAVLLAAPPAAAVGGLSAAALWGGERRGSDLVHLVVPRTLRLRRNDRTVVHFTTLASDDVVLLDGLRVTTPERTIFDLGRRAPRVDALVALDMMLRRGVLEPATLRRMMHTRELWPNMDRLIELVPLGNAGSESPMETRLRLLLIEARVPPPVAQFEVSNRRGQLIARVDLAWPELRLAVEYDGDHHREPGQFRRDAARLNALRLAGWTVLRFTANDVLRTPGKTVFTVIAMMAQLRES